MPSPRTRAAPATCTRCCIPSRHGRSTDPSARTLRKVGIASRRRLDGELVRRGLAPSRQQARALIERHGVKVNGSFADKPARLVDLGDSVELVAAGPQFVSRGGEKLAGALDAFGLDPSGLRCLDAGASTGGFTDCLLQRGAREVVAVDVGYGQLHESLRSNPAVHNLERTNIRDITVDDIGGAVEMVVGDLSFISLRAVMGPLRALCVRGAPLVLLVKPQFEAGRQEASRGKGVIREPVVWRRVLEEVAAGASSEGMGLQAAVESPLRGGSGNVEFLFHLQAGAVATEVDLDGLVDSVSKNHPSPG